MPFTRILVAVHEQNLAAREVAAGTELARAFGACLALVHVVDPQLAFPVEGGLPPETMIGEERRAGEEVVAGAAVRTPDEITPETFMREGKPEEEIIALAREWGADLIVAGTHARGTLARLLLGSTSDAVVRDAPCPILLIREEAAGGEARSG